MSKSRAAIDRRFAWLLVLQWLAAIATAVLVSPRTWIGASSQVHAHVWMAIVFGAVLASLPACLVMLQPGRALNRHCIGVAQMLFSALLIHLTGGRIETHFHVFGSLAFLASYRDWRVLGTATVVVAIDHFLRGLWWPESVFGTPVASDWRWLEHAGWVLFEDSVLVLAIARGLREAREIAGQRAELEAAKFGLDRQVRERTLELEVARRAAEAASQAKTQFLANMSHEIRTPMTAILGYAELLEDSSLQPDQRTSHLRVVRRNGEHLLSVINDILDISKIEAGRLTVDRAPCRICQIVAEVAALMRVRAAGKGVALVVEYVFPVPEEIRSDSFRVRQILMNLVGNAIKFTEHGSVNVIVRSDGLADAHPFITIEVTDTGIGMTSEAVSELFRPFAQVDSSQTRRHGGTGLGLAISQRLATALGGDINVQSEPGRGSTFRLRLPTGDLAGVRLITQAEEAITPAEADEPAKADGRLHGRILLAEDGPDNQRLIAFHLRKAGAEVEIVDDGRQAVEAALRARGMGRPFDVILMDMQMPVLDGYSATRELREQQYAGPILALTAHAMSGDRQRCLQAGCDDYDTKPITPRRLCGTVARYLRQSDSALDRAVGRAA